MGKIIPINLVTCFVVYLIVQNNPVEMIFLILQLLLIIEQRNAVLDLQLKDPRQIGQNYSGNFLILGTGIGLTFSVPSHQAQLFENCYFDPHLKLCWHNGYFYKKALLEDYCCPGNPMH